MPDKVRLQDRITDAHLKNLLNKSGMSDEYVELISDYSPRRRGKGHTPYAQFYRDRMSGKGMMVAGILPHITNAGFFIVPQWRSVGSKFIAEENCFEAEIDNGTVKVVCVNDQPNGRKQGDWAEWHPQVFLGGVEQQRPNPIWLDVDPINAGYNFNTIEWDYGCCKRRARTIPGRFRDRIYLLSDPGNEVQVRNNKTGNMRLEFGSRDGRGLPIGRVVGDVEIISKEELANAKYPITIGASPETFYPDAGIASVDGNVFQVEAGGVTWATIIAAAGNGSDDTGASLTSPWWRDQNTTDRFRLNVRTILVYDTAGLPDAATITDTVLSFWCTAKQDPNSNSPNLCVYESAPASPTALANGDYNSLLTVELSNILAYGSIATGAYNDYTFNASGIALVSKTSTSPFGVQNANYDVAGSLPTWASAQPETGFTHYYAEQGNTTNDPKLVVTYTLPGYGHDVSGVAAANIAKVNGVATADIAKINGVA